MSSFFDYDFEDLVDSSLYLSKLSEKPDEWSGLTIEGPQFPEPIPGSFYYQVRAEWEAELETDINQMRAIYRQGKVYPPKEMRFNWEDAI